MRVISHEQSLDLLDWDEIIAAIRQAYGSGYDEAMDPGRLVARGSGSIFRTMAAASPSGRYMGAKLFAASNSQPRIRQLVIVLFSQENARIEAIIDGRAITMFRTAATSAFAVDLLCRDEAIDVAVLGSGHEARSHVEAVNRVRDIRSLKVFSPTAANRVDFAKHFSDRLGLTCVASDSAESAVANAGLVLATARSHDETPIVKREWCQDDVTIVSIGSTVPEQREIGPDIIDHAKLVVCDNVREVLEETGDLIAARRQGVDVSDKVFSLAAISSKRAEGWNIPPGLRLFKSVGSGLQDIVAAECVLELAKSRDIGVETQVDIGVAIRP